MLPVQDLDVFAVHEKIWHPEYLCIDEIVYRKCFSGLRESMEICINNKQSTADGSYKEPTFWLLRKTFIKTDRFNQELL